MMLHQTLKSNQPDSNKPCQSRQTNPQPHPKTKHPNPTSNHFPPPPHATQTNSNLTQPTSSNPGSEVRQPKPADLGCTCILLPHLKHLGSLIKSQAMMVGSSPYLQSPQRVLDVLLHAACQMVKLYPVTFTGNDKRQCQEAPKNSFQQQNGHE